MERLQGSHYVLGWNDSRGVLLSWNGTNPGESFSTRMERLLCSPSVLGWNDCRRVILSWDGTTSGGISVLGWNDSRGVILSWDGTTPGESFCSGMEILQGSQSVLG